MDALADRIKQSLEDGMGETLRRSFPPAPSSMAPIATLDDAVEAVASAERAVDQLALRIVGGGRSNLPPAPHFGGRDDSLADQIREAARKLQAIAEEISSTVGFVHRRLDGQS